MVLDDSNHPFYKWFSDGELNLSVNCLDRHLDEHGDQVAYNWVGEPGDTRVLTYSDLHAEVCRFANGLLSLGLETGDRVAIYMGMVPELPIAMLACARLGLVHSVVFGGFSAEALSSRIIDADARLVITQDGAWRAGNIVPLKVNSDLAVSQTPGVEHVVVVQRTNQGVDMTEGRDIWWHELVEGQSDQCDPVILNAEHPLYILYTSGTTGKPKGIVHTQGGYLTGIVTTHSYVFDLKPDTDVYWCGADIGWVTGHSYIVYGPLANRATSMMYEGAPNFPDFDRLWQIIEDYKVTIFYTAPTAIRTFMKWGDHHVSKHDLSSLRLIGTVGEPINPEAWIWYQANIGSGKCPIVDTWWQTETGAIMITPLPGVVATKPGSATHPVPGDLRRCGRRRTVRRFRSVVGAISPSPSRGRRWPAPSTATTSVSSTPTGHGSLAATSPVTGRSGTRRAISGCWGGSTTSCWCPDTTSRPPRSSPPWSLTPRWPRPRWLVAKTS